MRSSGRRGKYGSAIAPPSRRRRTTEMRRTGPAERDREFNVTEPARPGDQEVRRSEGRGVRERMSPEAFREALASHKHTLPQLRRKLEHVPAIQRAPALLAVFAGPVRPEAAYRDQEVAGNLLVDLVPEPQQPLDELLRAAAPVWNVSVEQLPFYLREVFGREAVVEAARRLAGEFPADSREARALLTVSWWLSGNGVREAAEPLAAPDKGHGPG